MIIKFSRDQELNIERIYHTLKKEEVQSRKQLMLNKCCRLIDERAKLMEINEFLDEIILDIPQRSGECFSMSEDRRNVKIYYDNLEDEREFAQSVIHQLGHVQDVIKRGFSMESFEFIRKIDAGFAFFIWDVFLNGRLSREKHFTYFQVQSLYYECKMDLRSRARKEQDSVDGYFDTMWNNENYKVLDVKTMFDNFL